MIDFTIIEHNNIDSTNNYAMRLIDADKAQHGMTITAQTQNGGRGQRGNTWVDTPGMSLLMSIIVNPKRPISNQFAYNAAVAVAIANVLQKMDDNWRVYVKWPNDIIVNDKKAGGVLIENVLRGNQWTYSIIGIGLNVNQRQFDETLPFATSLKLESGTGYDIRELLQNVRGGVMGAVDNQDREEPEMDGYNRLLYRRGMKQAFREGDETWEGTIVRANNDGTLVVTKNDGTSVAFHHGQISWVWGK